MEKNSIGMSREEFLESSRLRPCSLEAAEHEYSDLPSFTYDGLAFVPYLKLSDDTTAMIRHGSWLLDSLHIEREEWLQIAKENDQNRKPVLRTLGGIIQEILPETDTSYLNELPQKDMLYYFSYEDMYGATVILNQKAMDAAAESLKRKSLYLLPSSAHELLIAPNGADPKELQKIVAEVNRSGCVKPEDVLSDSIYQYHPITKDMKRYDGKKWIRDVHEKQFSDRKRDDKDIEL